jgi:protease I
MAVEPSRGGDENMTGIVDSQQLTGRAVAFLIADGVSLIELEEPHRMLEAAGARVELVAPHYGEVLAMDYLEKAGTVPVDRALLDADATRYDALVLPGGVANADHLRRDPDAVAFVAAFPAQARSVAAICHAPWLLVEAGMVQGRTLTSWPSLKTDIRNAGGVWVDEPVHVDERFITSRGPRDLAAFCDALTTALLDTHARNDRPAGR